MRLLAVTFGLLLNLWLYAAAGALGDWHPLQTMAALAVLNFIAILIHELGHAWAFRRVGGTVKKIVVLFAAYDVRRRRLGWSRLPASGDVGGYVSGAYRPSGPTVHDQMIVAGGGPAANLLTGSMMLVAVFSVGMSQPSLPSRPNSAELTAIAPASEAMMSAKILAPLPSETQLALAMARYSKEVRSAERRRFVYTMSVLFSALSIGLAILNLLPFGGSDGQKIARAIRLKRVMTGS